MKGIKMLMGALAAASLLFSVSAYAQENNNRDENGNVVRGAYETNKAFDNFYISVAGGINATIAHELNPSSWGNIGLATELNVGKWFTPAIGVRAGWQGLWNEAKDGLNQMDIEAGKPYGYNYIHADFVWNMLNTFCGYKETRLWNVAPYLTTGVLAVSKGRNVLAKGASVNLEYAAGAGIYNIIRVHERVNITLDVRGLIGRARTYDDNSGKTIVFPSATVGLAFNIGKTNFDRHSTIAPPIVPVPFTVEQYNALESKLAALEKENASLKDKLAGLQQEKDKYKNLVNGQTYLYENGTFTAVDVKPGSPLTVYFDLGSAKLSAREQAHLEYFVENVIDGNTKISVNGYADKQTGSARRNQQLSEQRVQTVVDLLTKAGANASNIETAAHGSEIQLFDGAAKNRVATIEVK